MPAQRPATLPAPLRGAKTPLQLHTYARGDKLRLDNSLRLTGAVCVPGKVVPNCDSNMMMLIVNSAEITTERMAQMRAGPPMP